MIKITYDKEGDILEIRFSEAKAKESEYIKEVGIVIDYDEDNNIIGVEILSFSKKVSKEEVSEVIAEM
jgi:uncharacterized protein YuzE